MEWSKLHENLIDPLFIYNPEKGITKYNLSFLLYFDFTPRDVRKFKKIEELVLNPTQVLMENIKVGTYQELTFDTPKGKKQSVLYLIEPIEENQFLIHMKDAAIEMTLQEKYSKQILELERINRDQELIIIERTKDLQESYQLMRRVLTSLKGEVYVLDEQENIKATFGANLCTDLKVKFSEGVKLNSSEKNNFDDWFDSFIMLEDQRDVLISLAPEKFNFESKVFRPDYFQIPNSEKFEMAVIINDVTEEELLKIKSKQADELSSAIHKALLNKNNFYVFHTSFKKLTTKYTQKSSPIDILTFKRDLHTLKGLFSQYGLKNSSSEIHQLEEEVGLDQEEGEKKLIKILSDANEVIDKLISLIGKDLLFPNETNLSLESMLGFFETTLNDTLIPLSKEKSTVKTLGDTDLILNQNQMDQLTIALLHYARNLAAHAAEVKESRLTKNKRPGMTVYVSVKKSLDLVEIKITDDGKGTEKQNDVFIQKASDTSKNADLYSGRGLGMTAIKEAIDSISGEVSFSSKIDVGSLLKIVIPLSN